MNDNYPVHNRTLMYLNQAFVALHEVIGDNLIECYQPGKPMHYYDERELVRMARRARNLIDRIQYVATKSGKTLEQLEREYDEYMQLRDEKIKADVDDARAAEREESEE